MSSAFGTETVLDVRRWTHDYFSFTTTTGDDGFRFDNGQLVMIGLEVSCNFPAGVPESMRIVSFVL